MKLLLESISNAIFMCQKFILNLHVVENVFATSLCYFEGKLQVYLERTSNV